MQTDSNSVILEYIRVNPNCSSKEILENANSMVGLATIKRILQKNVSLKYVEVRGKGKNTRYQIGAYYELLFPINVEDYFKEEADERKGRNTFNFEVFELVQKAAIYEKEQLDQLAILQSKFTENTSHLTPNEYQIELERLAIDLSWKSSQIEGNTYSLLETERLLKRKETAAGKTKEEATMLLNHKKAMLIFYEQNNIFPFRTIFVSQFDFAVNNYF